MKSKIFFLFLAFAKAEDIFVQELSTANNFFTIELYKTIYQSNNKNFVLSPISAETILSLIYSGSRTQTAEELRKVLHFSSKLEDTESGFRTFLSNFQGNGFYTLQLVNRIYANKNIAIKATFKKSAKQFFKTDIINLDFRNKIKTAKLINTWVAKNTRNKIKKVVTADLIRPKGEMIALSAFYFRANWTTPFPIALTRKVAFYKSVTESVLVNMMSLNNANLNYFESLELNAKFLELEFRGGDASMVVVLPNARDGLAILQSQIQKVLEPKQFQVVPVNVVLPKFKLETRLHLNYVLKAMGCNKPFERKDADLSGIAGKKGSFVVDNILQKVFLNIEEGGVEVAGVTEADVLQAFAAPRDFVSPKQFIADHPFIYYIKITNFIAFIGRVVDPSQ